MRYLFMILFTVSSVFAELDKTVETYGNVSTGKFYKYSTKPIAPFSENNPCLEYSDGSKLTDDDTSESFDVTRYVGFKDQEEVSVTIDLGRVHEIKKLRLHIGSYHEIGVRYPQQIQMYVGKDQDSLQEASKLGEFADDTRRFSSQWLEQNFSAKGRYVKLVFVMGKKILLLDEIEVFGTIRSKWRMVPEEGCYHGAFCPAYGFSKEQRADNTDEMRIDLFEQLAGKQLAMLLWYQGMAEGRDFKEVLDVWKKYSPQNYQGKRLFMYGWLPKRSSKDIAQGCFDSFFQQYFKDSVDPELLGEMTDPFFFRPMNEFNGHWTDWSLDPSNYKRAWRRMYNIAQKIGAADKHIFVWSVNHKSYPDAEFNRMDNYYPGDNYVDWVGISCYPPSMKFVSCEAARYPKARIKEVYELYADKKPIIIAEGGFDDKIDRSLWVSQWFESLKADYPLVKAFIWENHFKRVLQSDEKALGLYKKYVKDDYWLDQVER
jgi:glycosyl hydrolase family 26